MRAAPTARLRSAAQRSRRPGLGVADQLLSAATNVVTTYVASLLLSPEDFGRFVLAFACVTVVLAAGRGLIGGTVLVHLPAQDDAARHTLVRSALGFTAVAGIVALVVLSLVGLGEDVLWWFLPWVPLALFQDVGRHVLFAAGRPGSALVLDGAWALVQALAIGGWVLVGGSVTIGVLATGWGLGALAGVVTFALRHGARPTRPGRWMQATRDVAGWFTAVAVIGQVEVYLVLLLAGALLGSADVGAVRAVQLLAYQPAVVVLGALLTVLLPSAVRARSDPEELRRVWRRTTVAVTPAIGGLGLLALLREPLMSTLFAQYVEYAALVVPIAIEGVFVALSVAPSIVLRALRLGRGVLVVQVLRLAALAGAALVGMLLAGVNGLAWGLAGASVASWLLVTLVARRAMERDTRRRAEPPLEVAS